MESRLRDVAVLTIVNAVVDIGNTAVKVCGVQDGNLHSAVLYFGLHALPSLAMQGPLLAAGSVVIGCSGNPSLATDLAAQVFARGGEAIVIGRDAALPFKSDYAAGQAGVDRLANVAAAIEEEGGTPVIIIDAGSAVTVEMISPSGIFRGGVIMPGFRLQARNLSDGTASLPLVDFATDYLNDSTLTPAIQMPATSTEAAIKAGVYLSCMGGIEKTVRDYLRIEGMEQAQIIVTGGDGKHVAANLDLSGCILCPRPARYDAKLTLKGLLLLAKAQQ